MNELNAILGAVSDFLWGWPMIILLLGTHLYQGNRPASREGLQGGSSMEGLIVKISQFPQLPVNKGGHIEISRRAWMDVGWVCRVEWSRPGIVLKNAFPVLFGKSVN